MSEHVQQPRPFRGLSVHPAAGVFDLSRAAIVAAAESYLRTPFHHAARVRGAGIDCVNLLCAAYEEAGLTSRIELPYYPPDWMMHRNAELFMAGALERLTEVEKPRAGDVALFKFGRCYSHGAIVIEWPSLIHSFVGLGVVYGDARRHPLLDHQGDPRPVKFYSLFA